MDLHRTLLASLPALGEDLSAVMEQLSWLVLMEARLEDPQEGAEGDKGAGGAKVAGVVDVKIRKGLMRRKHYVWN